MHIGEPSSHDQAPSSAGAFDYKVSSPPRCCCQCAEYSSRILDLENRLTLAKCQAHMTIDKASKTCALMKQISILDYKVSSLMAKIVHHEECESFVIGIIESACEMLYVSNVSIIFYAPCLFLHHLPIVSLHLVAFLCIFRN
jgi:hypothetical protein